MFCGECIDSGGEFLDGNSWRWMVPGADEDYDVVIVRQPIQKPGQRAWPPHKCPNGIAQ
jgi:hypothetical protein